MSEQPKPCPFCGHVGLEFGDGSTYRWGIAYCGACAATCGEVRREYPDTGKWHAEAIKEWNTRAPLPDELRRFLDAAAGEGFELDGVDAGDLFLKLFPDAFKASVQSPA